MHVRAARTNGLTVDEIKEVLLQTAIYCGVPDANTAFRIAQQVLARRRHRDLRPSCTPPPARRSAGSAARSPRCAPTTWPRSPCPGVLAKAPDLDPAAIGDVVWGNANEAGEDNRNVGRMAVLLAGLPVSVPATTVNRLCGSSLDAAMIASRTIETGDADVVVAGGVESMTRAPWVLPKPSRAFPAGNVTAVSTTLGLAAGQRADAGGVDGLARRGQRAARREVRDLAGAAGRVRRPLAPAGRRGLGRRLLRRPRGPGARRRAGPRRGHPARLDRREAGRAEAVVPPGRHDHRRATPRRSTTGRPPCCSAPSGGRPDRARPARPDRRSRRVRGRAAAVRLRAGRGRRPGARPGRHRLGRRRRGRAQRGVRGAVARLRRRLEDRPGDRQHQGRRDRDRPPARRVRRPDPRHPRRAGCASPATGGAWPRSASASARRSPWCWRTSS